MGDILGAHRAVLSNQSQTGNNLGLWLKSWDPVPLVESNFTGKWVPYMQYLIKGFLPELQHVNARRVNLLALENDGVIDWRH